MYPLIQYISDVINGIVVHCENFEKTEFIQPVNLLHRDMVNPVKMNLILR